MTDKAKKRAARPLLVWGGTGHARVLEEFVGSLNYRIRLVVDSQSIEQTLNVPHVQGIDGLATYMDQNRDIVFRDFAIAIGGSKGRERHQLGAELSSLDLHAPVLIHPTATIASNASIGDGCHILMRACLGARVNLDSFVIVNTNAQIDHDTTLQSGVHAGPGCVVCGEVQVGSNSFIGAGSVVLPKLSIGRDCVIGAGAVVTRDLADGETVVGVPARPLNVSH